MPIKPLENNGPREIPGFEFSGIHAGIKKKPDSLDMALIKVTSPEPANIAALFTTNRLKAAPVILCQQHIDQGKCRAIITNSGNANACTGELGLKNANKMAEMVADGLNCPADEVFVSSTGVIGSPLPMDAVKQGIQMALGRANEKDLPKAAQAICTTDTFEKIYGSEFKLDGKKNTLCGFTKGAGMIQPDMATTLTFLMTDAHIPSEILDKALVEACTNSFNAITVDGEMSTNDSIFLLANGLAKNKALEMNDSNYISFVAELSRACDFLAKQIVRDGEGISKFVELHVSGLENEDELKNISYAIANSYLVRTTFCGEDPNWGRIVSAAGACAARMNLLYNFDHASIAFDDHMVLKNGEPQGVEVEKKAAQVMKNDEFKVHVTLGPSTLTKKIYTSDLTKDYISINADYRT